MNYFKDVSGIRLGWRAAVWYPDVQQWHRAVTIWADDSHTPCRLKKQFPKLFERQGRDLFVLWPGIKMEHLASFSKEAREISAEIGELWPKLIRPWGLKDDPIFLADRRLLLALEKRKRKLLQRNARKLKAAWDFYAQFGYSTLTTSKPK